MEKMKEKRFLLKRMKYHTSRIKAKLVWSCIEKDKSKDLIEVIKFGQDPRHIRYLTDHISPQQFIPKIRNKKAETEWFLIFLNFGPWCVLPERLDSTGICEPPEVNKIKYNINIDLISIFYLYPILIFWYP